MENFVQRKRLGEVRHLDLVKNFGFIKAEDFREDVFFHLSVWETDRDMLPETGMVVEFEIDRHHLKEKQQLRALVVRRTNLPYTKQLNVKEYERLTLKHHPKARKRKPSWRKSDS